MRKPNVVAAVMLALSFAGAPARAASVQHPKILAPGGAETDRFGQSVALSGDRLVAGAPYRDEFKDNDGAAHVYRFDGSRWAIEASLFDPIPHPAGRFGWAVAIEADTIAVGAPYSWTAIKGSGVVHVFARAGSQWSLAQSIGPPDGVFLDAFGTSVAMDGDVMAIGAPDVRIGSNYQGAAYVYRRVDGAWTYEAKLVPSVPTHRAGYDVAIDGDTVVLGAPRDPANGVDAGAVFVFARDGGTWSQQARLLPTQVNASDLFGASAALDGDTLLVGAPSDSTLAANNGAVYVFSRAGATWSQGPVLHPDGSGLAGASFGYDVALQGETAAIGRPGADVPIADAGSIEMFRRSGATWSKRESVVKTASTSNWFLGMAIGLDGHLVASGTADNEQAYGAGAVIALLFDLDPPTIAASVEPAQTVSGWHTTSPTISFSCSDVGTGLASCTAPHTVPGEWVSYRQTGTATDRSGNATSTAVTVKVDLRPPETSIDDPAAGSGVLVPAAVVTGEVLDLYSGVRDVVVTFRNLQSGELTTRPATLGPLKWRVPATGLPPGATAAAATARDNAGHTVTTPEVRFTAVV